MSSIATDIAALLGTVRVPGDFYAAGTIAFHLPRIEVQGVGPLALPLLPAQAKQLIAAAELAPYGRGERTLVDPAVRRTWQIGAGRVRIAGLRWDESLASVVARAAVGLGVTQPVRAELYKLLVYDEGSFFVSHRDTEKAPGMFATLIVALPSLHEGGELVVRHKGREARLGLQSEDPSEVAFAAFYADCVHEVLPVTSGCRLAFVYNLLRTGRGRLPQPPCYEAQRAGLAALLQRWGASKESASEDDSAAADSPEKWVYPLQHAYTPAELSYTALKGPDAAAAAVLAAAVEDARCDVHVALLTIEESGWAEHTGNSSRFHGSRRWGRDDDEDDEDDEDDDDDDDESDDDFEAGEVDDRSATLSHWVKPDGQAARFGDLPFDEHELCPPGALDDMEPDEEHFHEATGNEGASFERSYQRAALVLWPQCRRLAVFNQGGLRATLPHLGELTRRWLDSGAGEDSPLWREAHEFSGHMLRTWRKIYPNRSSAPSNAGTLLGLLAQLRDTQRIETFVLESIACGTHGEGDNAALIAALRRLPATRASAAVERVVAANAGSSLAACAGLLARAAKVDAFTAGLVGASRSLVEALPGDPARAESARHFGRVVPIEPGVIVDLLTAVSLIDAESADRAVAQLLAWPKAYGLGEVILPALRRLVAPAKMQTHPAVERLRARAIEHLRARTALPLEAPRDWARAGALDCGCGHCRELSRFLLDPARSTWNYKAAELARSHLELSIRRAACDVDCTTDKRGRPYGPGVHQEPGELRAARSAAQKRSRRPEAPGVVRRVGHAQATAVPGPASAGTTRSAKGSRSRPSGRLGPAMELMRDPSQSPASAIDATVPSPQIRPRRSRHDRPHTPRDPDPRCGARRYEHGRYGRGANQPLLRSTGIATSTVRARLPKPPTRRWRAASGVRCSACR